ncbi:MAG: hypothetical protein KC496_10385, partial [Anaerolineae bacterium]|nr:hypothetical protein [Anaerolineae bacterium]
SNMLPALGNSGSNVILTLQTLQPGQFLIDGFQVLYATALVPGYYEENVGDGVLLQSTDPVTSESEWQLVTNSRYSSSAALSSSADSSTIQFEFTGSGVSVVTAFNSRSGGEISVQVTGGGIDRTRTLDTKQGTAYGTAVTITGLPYDPGSPVTYTATITATNELGESVIVDAIEVYDELQTLGSLYDDNENTPEGLLYFTYGPGENTWSLLVGRTAITSLNETMHLTAATGAVASFEVQNAFGINVLYENRRTRTTTIEVCFRDTGTLTETCTDETLNGSGIKTVAAPAQGDYFVSIIGANNLAFALDAVQVLEEDPATGSYHEGIYGAQHFEQYPGSYTLAGNAALTTGNAINLPGNGDSAEFSITGIGFSFVVSGTSTSYNVCVTDVTECDVINEDLPLTGETVNGVRAITYVGLHDGSGNESTLDIRLTNLNNNPIAITEVHVMGDDDSIIISDTSRYENDDAQSRYLPFGSFTEVEEKRGSSYSGGSQHIGTDKGSLIYLEFTDLGLGGTTGFDYIRELSTRYGSVEICYGTIGNGVDIDTQTLADARAAAQCQSVDNNTSAGGQGSEAIEPIVACTSGCWASIRNLDGLTTSFDYLRLFDTSAPLTEGFYQDTYAGLTYADSNGVSSLGWQQVNDSRSLGSSATQIIADAADLTNSNGPTLSFLMEGTGFTVYFTGDRDTDAVRLCYADYTGVETVDNALAGTCQTFDTEVTRTTYAQQQTIAGLPNGQYVVAVQMLADNYAPAPHNVRYLPLKMSVEAVEILGTEDSDWQNLTALQAGGTYEFNYENRLTDNTFIYVGDGWSTISNSRARFNTNVDYDYARAYGSGVVFHTVNANAMTLNVNLGRRNTTMRVCITPEDGSAETRCLDYPLTGNEYNTPISFRFTDFGATAATNYVVTLFALDAGDFILDTVQLHDVTALTEGTYEATNPALYYDGRYENYVI